MRRYVLVLDFGAQYTQLIARRVRELNVYCEIHPFNHLPEITAGVKGIILSGGPASVRDKKSPAIDLSVYRKKLPVLGICYGAQLIAQQSGGKVLPSKMREYGRASLDIYFRNDELFNNVNDHSQVWMSHSDTISSVPQNFIVTAGTGSIKIAAFHEPQEKIFGVHFSSYMTAVKKNEFDVLYISINK